MHVIAVEYPGYGVYTCPEGATAEKIEQDAESVYKFLTSLCQWKENDIVVCGRSIGSGPACFLANRFKPAALALVSPHTSIRGVVKDFFMGGIAQFIVAERFKNLEAIEQVNCPTFILHGQRDETVNFSHSQQLCDACGGPAILVLPEDMDHNNLDTLKHFISPLSKFLEDF
jgi:pimeloyl-ACP methyl ester carboxylesterase